MCVVCLAYSGHTQGCCSVCVDLVESLRKPWEEIEHEFSPEELFQLASQRSVWAAKQAAEDVHQSVATLDRVSHELAMKPQTFEHFRKILRSGSDASPEELAKQLLEFGHPLVTAVQAKSLLETLRGRGETDYRYYHVLCSRVVDPWNLDAADHGIGHCYYGYDNMFDPQSRENLAKLVGASDRETLAAVFWRLLRPRLPPNDLGFIPVWRGWRHGTFQSENFWTDDLVKFIREEMRKRGIAQAVDVLITCHELGALGAGGSSKSESGIVSCTTAAGNTIGRFEVPSDEAAFGQWLRGRVSQAASTLRGPGARLCLVTPDGEVLWREQAPSLFKMACRRLRGTGIN